MAKALMGHLGGPDPRVLAELVSLRRRVTELEAEVAHLRDLHLADVEVDHELLVLDETQRLDDHVALA